MSGRRFWLSAILASALAACQTPVTPTAEAPTLPAPTQQVVQVELSPALAPWMARLSECGLETASSGQPSIALLVHEGPANAISLEKAGLVLRIGSSAFPDLTGSQVGVEELVLIVNPTNPIDRLDPESLEMIFSGRLDEWTELDPKASFDMPIQPWSYETGDDAGAAFERLILGEAPVSESVYRAPGPEAMLQAVQENPGAVGYIPGSWFDGSVREIHLKGEQVGEFALPVVAFTSGEPQGPIRQLIGCLQAKPVSTP